MPNEKLYFINAAAREAYRAGVERGRQMILDEVVYPIFAAYAKSVRQKATIPSMLSVTIDAGRTRIAMSTPEQRAVASGLLDHDHDERGPRPE